MDHFAGLDVSVYETSVCFVDDTARPTAQMRFRPCALQERLADALHRAAMDLPSQQRRIERGYSVLRGAESPKQRPRPRSGGSSSEVP